MQTGVVGVLYVELGEKRFAVRGFWKVLWGCHCGHPMIVVFGDNDAVDTITKALM